jgi:hypothetical protein
MARTHRRKLIQLSGAGGKTRGGCVGERSHFVFAALGQSAPDLRTPGC